MYQQLMARSARAASIVAAGLMLWAGPHNAQAQCEFEWSDGFNVPGTNGAVLSTTIFDDGRGPALYVGVGFSSVGGASASGIARWDCGDGCDPCDMNCDGGIDASDIEPFLNCLFP